MRKRFIAVFILIVIQCIYAYLYLVALKDSVVDKYIPEEYNLVAFIAPLVLLGLIAAYVFGSCSAPKKDKKDSERLEDELDIQRDITKNIISNSESVSKDLPIGLIIFDKYHHVSFSNEYTSRCIFLTPVLGKDIKNLSQELEEKLSMKQREFDFKIYGKIFKASVKYDSSTIYMFDVTEERKALESLRDTRPAIVILSLGNIQCISALDVNEQNEILGQYYGAISEWRKRFDLYILSDSSYKQTYLIKDIDLDKMKKDDFSLFVETDLISKNGGFDISVSIGIGTGSDDFKTLGSYAEEALQHAMDRGGNQAVVYNGEKKLAFGGKVSSFDRKTRASARFFASRFVDAVKTHSSVLIIPHKDADADAIGSAMGIQEICEALGTPARVLYDENSVDKTVGKIVKASMSEYIKFHQSLITPDEADKFVVGKPLIVYTDHHDLTQTLSTKYHALQVGSSKEKAMVVVIDHHASTDKEHIKPVISYIDHAASSAVELVAEIATLLPIQMRFAPFTATAMLTGMEIDTTGFQNRISSSTFFAASFLIECGADAVKAKSYIRVSAKEKSDKIEIQSKAKIIAGRFAVYTFPDNVIKDRAYIAKVADSLLELEDIDASFVIGRKDKETACVSARSSGAYNCYLAMEKMGGGGHFTMAGTQAMNKSCEELRIELESILQSRDESESDKSMKIILTQDVKKQGKKGDVIDVSNGFGNHLISANQAIEANPANLAVLNEERETEEKQKKNELEVAKKLSEILNKTVVTVKVKTGADGKFFGSISTKLIADELLKQFNITVDKKKIELPESKIDSLGSYSCKVKLNKNLTEPTILRVDVKEEKGI